MSSFEEYPNPLDHLIEFTDKLNEEKARELRMDMLRLAHEAFSVFRNLDAESLERTKAGAFVERYLQLDILASPALTHDEFVDALKYTLVRSKERAPGDTFGADRIHMFLPVPADFHIGDEPSEIPDFEDVSEIYVMFEKDRPDGVHTRRFVISRDDVYEYAVLTDEDYDSDSSDILGKEMHHLATDTQNLSMAMVSQLFEDHKNFSAQQFTGA